MKKLLLTNWDAYYELVNYLEKYKIYIIDELKYEDSDGSWEKYCYNKDGLNINYEDSGGYWETCTHEEDYEKIEFGGSDKIVYKINHKIEGVSNESKV